MILVYLAFRFFAFYVTNRIFRLGAAGMAFGGFTHGIANSGTMRIVTLPAALGMTLKNIVIGILP